MRMCDADIRPEDLVFMGRMSRLRRARLRRAQLRAEIWSDQGGLCFYCDCSTVLPNGCGSLSPDSATIEHLKRRADGGTDSPFNLVVACFDCNASRGETDWRDWLDIKASENCQDPDAGFGGTLQVFVPPFGTHGFDASQTWPWRKK